METAIVIWAFTYALKMTVNAREGSSGVQIRAMWTERGSLVVLLAAEDLGVKREARYLDEVTEDLAMDGRQGRKLWSLEDKRDMLLAGTERVKTR